jgi:hypothetical protein
MTVYPTSVRNLMVIQIRRAVEFEATHSHGGKPYKDKRTSKCRKKLPSSPVIDLKQTSLFVSLWANVNKTPVHHEVENLVLVDFDLIV